MTTCLFGGNISSLKGSSLRGNASSVEEGTLKSDLKGDRPSKEKLILLLLCLLTFVCSLVNFLGHSKLLGLSSSSSNEGIFPRRRLHTGGDSYQGKRVLYIVTSLSEFDNGERATSKGRNRFSETLVPVVAESSSSMVIHGYDVTIFLISHYRLAKYRIAELKDNLPRGVKLIAWHDATPLGYAFDNDNVAGHLDYITRALARQHRYVIKDHLSDFDLFVCFEDDMLIKGDHLSNFQQVSQYIYDLRSNAPHSLPTDKSLFYGPMTQVMLKRMLPGFIRVEVAPSDDWQPLRKRNNPLAKSFPEIPIDYNWNSSNTRAKLDPSICCHWRGERPRVERVRFWETSIEALGVRQMPDKSWVLLQAGNNESIYPSSSVRIGEFWSGEDHEEEYFHGKLRPSRSKGDLLNNQGGWMATRRQILEWHSERCFGGFLPPYDPPAMLDDGLATATVEYWSGGIQLVGIKSCNLQRIIPLDPKRFSQSLLYHTSNNKQRQRFVLHRFSGTHIEAFWGQLNTIKKNAEQRRKVDLQKLKDSLLRKTG